MFEKLVAESGSGRGARGGLSSGAKLRSLVVAAMLAAACWAVPSSAHATATGCTYFTGGDLCLYVYGDGLEITSMGAYFHLPNKNSVICNWRIDWVIYLNGKVWWRDVGPVNGCEKGGSTAVPTGSRSRREGWAPDGSQLCAELYTGSRKVDAACVGIEE